MIQRKVSRLIVIITVLAIQFAVIGGSPKRVRAAASALSDMVCTPLDPLSTTAKTGEKPQSKVWSHDGHWWSVLPAKIPTSSSNGTWLWKLVGTTWTEELQLSSETGTRADVKSVGDVVHILLYDDDPELVSVEYSGGTYQTWSGRAGASPISLPNSETATIDIDSTGRMWLASEDDITDQIVIYYSDSPYSSWNGPVTLAGGVHDDDIAVVTALPDNSIGVMWSNQIAQQFGFKVHVDGADPGTWSLDEAPLSGGSSFSDDHLNLAVASNGTLYAAVKTEPADSNANLIIRRPGSPATWDPLYIVDSHKGTRPIAVLNEISGVIDVIYTDSGIVYEESPISPIDFSGTSTNLISGGGNNASSSKQNYTNELVVISSSGNTVYGVFCSSQDNDSSLVAHYEMEEGSGINLLDSSSYRNDGSFTGDPNWVDGVYGQAVEFDGSDDFASVPDDQSLDIQSAITLSAWVKPTQMAAQSLVKKAVQSGTDGYEISLSSSGKAFVSFNQTSSGSTYQIDSTTTYPTDGDTWMHLAATYDGTTMKLFVNGVQEGGDLVGPSSIATNNLPLAVAAQSDGSSVFQGQLDEVRVYNRALAASEILALANVADLSITKDDGLNQADPGDPVTYSIQVVNYGPSDSMGAVVSDNFPAGVTGLSWTCSATAGASCTASGSGDINESVNLPNGSSILYTVSGIFDSEAGGMVSNTASVTPPAGIIDTDPANNSATDTTILIPASPYALNLGPGTTTPYITFGDNLGLAQFTLETWFKRVGNGATTSTGSGGIPDAIPLITKGRGEADQDDRDMNYFLGIRDSDDVLCADFEEGASGSFPGQNHPVCGTTSIVPDTWYHVAVTYDSSSWQLFLNGNQEASLFVGEPVRDDSQQDAGLGSALNSIGTADGHFYGVLDEVRIWDYARSQSEIFAAINHQISSPQAGLIGRWALDEGSGSFVIGSAGTSLNGTIIGSGHSWTAPAPFNIGQTPGSDSVYLPLIQ